MIELINDGDLSLAVYSISYPAGMHGIRNKNINNREHESGCRHTELTGCSEHWCKPCQSCKVRPFSAAAYACCFSANRRSATSYVTGFFAA